MAKTLQKPVSHSSPAATRPVADARARALQEQIRALREQARQAGDRLLQANDRNRESLLQEWERAERACRQAEQDMARLRARSLGATTDEGPADRAMHNTRKTEPMGDPDRGLDRRHAAAAALNLLERASQPLLQNSPILEQGLTHPSDTATVTAAGIDFGPLVEEVTQPAVARKSAQTTKTAVSVPRAAASFTTAAKTPVATPARRATGHPHKTAPAREPAPVHNRSRFGIALLCGALLGAGGMLLAAALTHQLPAGFPGVQQVQQVQQTGGNVLRSLRQRLAE
ncbi:MAG: hypothetical protein OQK27_05575 [Gammaproteobacteria bacterium]|nr:hypothetical protein [Gammaproteobacteria bacterium]MCW9057488.1 hypothetical protein [Gammaproteobacteria bacterium]